MSKTKITILLSSMLMISGAQAEEYPTQARVEYVLQCMERHGGQSYDTLYPCICSFDKVAARMSYDKYTDAQTMEVMINTPGEKGGAFRDAPGARDLIKYYSEVRKNAEDSCFVNKKS